ncbi:hypothetical protein [Frondihabitans australicus]|uniref:Uncharacterized protein n=1 Tax=Frondihabitans australicus TaxID=386892 RepID=A0A495IGG4_9MICO|nr:hypothetical protein [Frondihabitans australicus]RKR74839.1 hypothetical protein C8E83_1970 [Frondihabitans australicus]
MSDTTNNDHDDDNGETHGIDHETPQADEVDPDEGTTDDGTPVDNPAG